MQSKEGAIGVIHTYKDIARMLKLGIETGGFCVVTEDSHRVQDRRESYRAFVSKYNPKIIIFDVTFPYRQNWQLFQDLQALPDSAGVGFVPICMGKDLLEKSVGKEAVIGVIGLPFELDKIIGEVRKF